MIKVSKLARHKNGTNQSKYEKYSGAARSPSRKGRKGRRSDCAEVGRASIKEGADEAHMTCIRRSREPFDRATHMLQHAAELELSAEDIACLRSVLLNGSGLAAMSQRLRATLCSGLYRVVGMVHCEARLLLHLCKAHGIPKPETLAAYVRSSGVTDHDKMVADVAESNSRAAKQDVESFVELLVRGTPLREALTAHAFSTSTPDLKWLPQMEEEIKKAHLQLRDKLSDMAMQVEPESGSFYPEDEGFDVEGANFMQEEDEGFDVEGANFMQELETGVAAVNIEARDERNAKEAATIVL